MTTGRNWAVRVAILFGLVLGLTGPIATAPTRVAAQSGIVYVGDIGSAASATQQSALVITTTAAVVEGDDIIVAFATYGDPDYTISVTDAAGNTYEQAATSTCYEYGRTYIFAAYDVTALPSGSHITITHTSVNGGTAAVASVFRGLVDVEPLDQSLGNPAAGAQQSASGTTPTVGPTGTTVQAHELVVGAIGTAGPVGDTPGSWDYDFTAGPRAGSTGASNYDWTVSIGYRIVSETGQYTAQKSGITSRNWAAAIATFKGEDVGPTHDLTLSVNPEGAGTTNPTVGVHAYAVGTSVDVTATAAPGYVFEEWSGACTGSGACVVTMDEDRSVTAHFVTVPPGTITYIGDIGSATSTTSQSSLVINTTAAVTAGDGIIVAFATYGDPDYTVSVTDSAGNTYQQAATSTCYEHGRTYIFAATDVNALPSGGSITITHTAVDGVTVAVASVFRGLAAVDPLDQSLGNPVAGAEQSASGTTPTVGPTGMTTQASELLIGAIGTEGPVSDAAGTWAYSFLAGPRAGTSLSTATDNWTVSMGYRIVSETGQYTAQKSGITSRYWAAAIATFKGADVGPTYDLTVAVSPDGGGTTAPSAGVHTYVAGTEVAVTAQPAPGYVFSEWSGACSGSGTCVVTMDEDRSVTAHFVSETTGILGDVDGNAAANSTDALIILSCDVDIDTSAYCPMNCGDVNADGLVNSTDALVILSYDVAIAVPYPVGAAGCPSSVTPCPGCNP